MVVLGRYLAATKYKEFLSSSSAFPVSFIDSDEHVSKSVCCCTSDLTVHVQEDDRCLCAVDPQGRLPYAI